MIVVGDIAKILNENEKKLLEYKCNNFVIDDNPIPKRGNNYVRCIIDMNEREFSKIINKINKIVSESTKRIHLNPSGAWINRIDNTTNKNDKYHMDVSFFTFIFYLNDNFDGGEFEYIKETPGKPQQIIKIQPKKYLSILSNNTLMHRVLPVNMGVRYSFVVFYDIIEKNNKSLI